jgi:hypothetical protein
MKRMLRKWLGIDYDPATQTIEARDILHGAEMAFVAYRIDNGYLLRMGGSLTLQNTIIYCTDEKDMIEKIVVHRSKTRLTGAVSITGSEWAAQKSNKY